MASDLNDVATPSPDREPAGERPVQPATDVREPLARATADEQRLEAPRKPFAIPYEGDGLPVPSAAASIQRVVERLLAAVGLVLTLPVMAATALAIKLDSKGPVLFRQPRAARSRLMRGKDIDPDLVTAPAEGLLPDRLYWVPTTFPFLKFRTMWVDAAERFPEYYWWQYDMDPARAQTMYYKLLEDPRLTRVGAWLRRTSLDELPNLWCVLRGDVALIGPRPESPGIQAYYDEAQMKKFTVMPGLSGPAEVYGRSELSVRERIVWDLEYVRIQAPMQDLRFVLQTIWVVVTRKGAR